MSISNLLKEIRKKILMDRLNWLLTEKGNVGTGQGCKNRIQSLDRKIDPVKKELEKLGYFV